MKDLIHGANFRLGLTLCKKEIVNDLTEKECWTSEPQRISCDKCLEALNEKQKQEEGKETLLPCPFCGSEEVEAQINLETGEYCIFCPKCGPACFDKYRRDSIHTWNNRKG